MSNTEQFPNVVKSANTANNDEVIDLRQYFKIINKYKWRVFFLAFFVAIFAAVITIKMTPIYRATATLLIEAEQAKAISFEDVMGVDASRKEYYLTQFEIIKSKRIAKMVIERLHLAEQTEFIKKESFVSNAKNFIKSSLPFLPKSKQIDYTAEELAQQQMQFLLGAFSERLTISPIRKTQLVNIIFESEDAKLAAKVANAVGDVYIENHLNAKMGVTQKVEGWLTSRLFDLRIRLDKSEEKLQNYREQQNLIDVEGVVGLISKELAQTSQQLVQSRLEKNKLESIMRVVNEYGRNNLARLESISEITSHKVIQDVKKEVIKTEQEVSKLAEVYGAKHPKMIAARAELNAVKTNLSKQIRELVTGIEKEVKTANANVQALNKELVRIRAEYQIITRKAYNYKKLKREVATNQKIYNAFFSRSKETEVTSDFSAAVARFTDRAYTPVLPVRPKKALIILLTFVATVGLGFVIAFVIEALNNTVKSSSDVENKLAQRMLGLLPMVAHKHNTDLNTHYFFEEKARQFSESVRTLRTSFVLTQLDKKSKVIEVTSSIPNEGKTTISTNLAFSLAQMENVLLIDADMRKPSICKRFGIPAYHAGLSNFIAGSESFDDCTFFDEKSNLTVMPCGQLPSNPLELLSSPKFAKVLADLSEKFDRIVIDTAPTQAVSDSLIVSRYADAVIYVVKADSTRFELIKSGLSRLIDVDAKIAGVVLNQVDMSKAGHLYGYHGYYDYYGYENDAVKVKVEEVKAEKKIA